MKTSPLHLFLLFFASAAALMLSACGVVDGSADPVTTIAVDPAPDDGERLPDDTVVMLWTETGGCAMAGPNCARYEVLVDGTVTTYRDGEPDPVASGTVDQTVVSAWVDIVQATDTSALVDRLGPGEMTAAFDGIDYFLEAPFTGFALSSVDSEFDEGEPFFVAAWDLARAAAGSAPLEVELR